MGEKITDKEWLEFTALLSEAKSEERRKEIMAAYWGNPGTQYILN